MDYGFPSASEDADGFVLAIKHCGLASPLLFSPKGTVKASPSLMAGRGWGEGAWFEGGLAQDIQPAIINGRQYNRFFWPWAERRRLGRRNLLFHRRGGLLSLGLGGLHVFRGLLGRFCGFARAFLGGLGHLLGLVRGGLLLHFLG